MDKDTEPMFEAIDPEEASDEKVSEVLSAYKEALEQEWKDKSEGATPKELAKKLKEDIRSLGPEALVSMRSLIVSASSESVRYNASKYILDNILLPGGTGAKDPLADFLEDLENIPNAQQTKVEE